MSSAISINQNARPWAPPSSPVLVAEDDEHLRRQICELLVEEGYAVVEAADGRQALGYLIDHRDNPPCLVLLDLAMPVMTGWELLTLLKSYVRLVRIPVVLISGCEPQLAPPWDSRIDAFLRKPYAPEALLEVVARHVARTREPA
jgi:CheY-like chemotaxis protein